MDFTFIAFDKGLDGLPLLFMHKKKIPGAAIKILRKKAIQKQVIRGRVKWINGRLVFILANNNAGKLSSKSQSALWTVLSAL